MPSSKTYTFRTQDGKAEYEQLQVNYSESELDTVSGDMTALDLLVLLSELSPKDMMKPIRFRLCDGSSRVFPMWGDHSILPEEIQLLAGDEIE